MTKTSRTGRPRDRRVDEAIAESVRELLSERGYSALTVDAVANRAGVGKAAIYRRYATKQEMTFSVLLHDTRETAPSDTGSLRGDLRALTSQIAEQLAQPSAAVTVGLLADVLADPILTERFMQTFVTAERSIVATLIDRAVGRGEMSNHPDPATVHALLLGPIFVGLMMDRTPPLADLTADMVHDSLVAGTS